MTTIKHENFVRKVFDKFGDQYTVAGEYLGYDKKVLIRHNVCDYEWYVWSNNLLSQKSKCPLCSGRVRYSTEAFTAKVNDLTNGEYIVLGEYVHSHTYIKMKHTICGHEWEVLPFSFITILSRRCPNCSDRAKYDTDRFKSKLKALVDDEYSVIGETNNQNTEVLIRHEKCNKEFYTTPNKFINYGSRCSYCNPSDFKGEVAISNFLYDKKIEFIRQYSFKDCRNINTLPFDFALFEGNKLILLIEYDGKQHYEPIDFFGGEDSFKQQVKRDGIKNAYCQFNNMPLLRIPYWEFDNIEEILNKKLIKLNIIKNQEAEQLQASFSI